MSLEPNELFPEVDNLYEFPSVHADMVYDEHRVAAYKRAIDSTVKPGDVITDVGTGTGLLAFLAIQAGAARVHAIDRSRIIDVARKLAAEAGWTDRIVFHQCDSRDVDLTEKVDVVVSELIGHIAFEEGMVETIFDARRRFLKEGGTLIPQTVTLYATPVYVPSVYASCIDCWRSAHGVPYWMMRDSALQNCYVVEIPRDALLASPKPVFFVDFENEILPGTATELTFKSHRRSTVQGLAFWFDATLTRETLLSSGPLSKTHWQQCFAPIGSPRDVQRGETIRFRVEMSLRSRKNDQFRFAASLLEE